MAGKGDIRLSQILHDFASMYSMYTFKFLVGLLVMYVRYFSLCSYSSEE